MTWLREFLFPGLGPALQGHWRAAGALVLASAGGWVLWILSFASWGVFVLSAAAVWFVWALLLGAASVSAIEAQQHRKPLWLLLGALAILPTPILASVAAHALNAEEVSTVDLLPALLPGETVSLKSKPATPTRGILVSITCPEDPQTHRLARVMGLPGERLAPRGPRICGATGCLPVVPFGTIEQAGENIPVATEWYDGKWHLVYGDTAPASQRTLLAEAPLIQEDEVLVLPDNRTDPSFLQCTPNHRVPWSNVRGEVSHILWSSDWTRIGAGIR